MLKCFLRLFLCLLPFSALAQEPVVENKDFVKKSDGVITSFKLNDHVWVIQTQLNKGNFELAAVDDKMQVVWRSDALTGYGISAGQFGGHLLAIAGTKYFKPTEAGTGPYTAYLIDEKSGKLLSQKIILDKTDGSDYIDAFFNDKRSGFTFLVRHTDHKNSPYNIYHTMPINSLRAVRLDNNLNSTVSQLKIPAEDFINVTCNNAGDIFLFTHPDEQSIKAIRYDASKSEPDQPIVWRISESGVSCSICLSDGAVASLLDPNSVYFSLVYQNGNNNRELGVAKFDFSIHAVIDAHEVFDRAHLKEIKDGYQPFDDKLDKPDFGVGLMVLQRMTLWNNTVVVMTGLRSNGNDGADRSLVINGYDAGLKPKFQQVMPSFCFSHFSPISVYGSKNSICIAAPFSGGMIKTNCLYGSLDLTNGQWTKLRKLPKTSIDKGDLLDEDVMWFDDSFIVPYKGSGISLQLNNY